MPPELRDRGGLPCGRASSADVIVVGAGLAGATTAHVLSRLGIRVRLIDPWPIFPPCFKAEKIEPEQSALFRKFGLHDVIRARSTEIREILIATGGRVIGTDEREQFGIFYQDMVNSVRSALPPSVCLTAGRVRSVITGDRTQQVTVDSGEAFTARLVVLACGTGGHTARGSEAPEGNHPKESVGSLWFPSRTG